jgi:hypothetical protein
MVDEFAMREYSNSACEEKHPTCVVVFGAHVLILTNENHEKEG